MSEEMIEKVARAIQRANHYAPVGTPDNALDWKLHGTRYLNDAKAAVSAHNPNERRCLTCGAQDPKHNEFCSDGFHAPGETYWPVDPNERLREALEALEAIKELADADETFLCWKTANDAIEALSPLPQGED